MMNCERAAVVLRGLEKNELVVTSEEIEELLKLGIVVEAMPDDLATLAWLRPIVREHANTDVGDPNAVPTLSRVLRATEEELKKDWYRIKTSKEELARREASRVAMRRALVYLSDPRLVTPLVKLVVDAQQVAPETRYVCCPQLGVEHYAMTHKGWRIRRSLRVRMERFGSMPLAKFVHSFDKSEAKMRAFSEEVRTLSTGLGYVRKNREQVVIGLVKSGAPTAAALDAYRMGINSALTPDVAVTCTRNASRFGSPQAAAARLRDAEAALLGAGFPATPIVLGTAKSLLAFDPVTKGLQRYVELMNGLTRLFVGVGRGAPPEIYFKYAARLMSATGMPAQIIERVAAATDLLRRSNVLDVSCRDPQAIAIAIAAMVPKTEALGELVNRFAAVKHELLRAGVTVPHHADNDALECVACPGSPHEVVDTVGTLMRQLAAGRQPERGDVAIAASFAKRFAY
ncbi:MAG: hypothetical protein U0270_36690 [Labilithrix sp.]